VAKVAAPSIAGVILRLSQLLVLLALSRIHPQAARTELIAAFGIVSSFAIISDSGAGNFLLARPRSAITQDVLERCLKLHMTIAVSGMAAALAFCLLRFEQTRAVDYIPVLLALALTPAFESGIRVARAPLLVLGQDHKFAVFDIGMAAYKTAVVGAAMLFQQVLVMTLMPAIALALLIVASRSMRRLLPASSSDSHFTREILAFGLNGAASTLYSQSPLIAAGAFLPGGAVAAMAICYRISQPLELIPTILGQQALPRLKTGTLKFVTAWSAFMSLGVVCCVVIVCARPDIEHVFSTRIQPLNMFLLIAIAVPVKFGNYAITANMFAKGLVAQKLRVTAVLGLMAAASSCVLAHVGGATCLAAVTICVEILLSAALMVVYRRNQVRVLEVSENTG
jgi:hypothetical protein